MGVCIFFFAVVQYAYEGKIVEAGTPDEVVMSPQSDYTKKLIDAAL